MAFQIMRVKRPGRYDALAQGILGGTQGFIQGQDLRRQREADTLAAAYRNAQIRELERKTEAFSAPLPTGFILAGDKVVADPSYVSPYEKSRIDYYNTKAGQGDNLTPGQRVARDRMMAKIFETVEGNKPKFESIESAEKSLPNVPQGLPGMIKTEWMRRFDPNNPMLADWQNLKDVLTDAQLMKTMKLKGAISDKEMALMSKAAANDDLMSIARMTPALKRLKTGMRAEEAGLMRGYQKIYGEDPHSWFDSVGVPTKKKAGQIVPAWAVGEEKFYEQAKQYGYSDDEIKMKLGR